MVTSYPFLAKSPAQVSPAGPLPTTATFTPFLGSVALKSTLCSAAQSAVNLSSLPIDTESPFIPKTHLPSHCFSCGQTLPQTAGSALYFATSFAAFSNFSSLTCEINPGILIETGHPSTHLGFLQFKHLAASFVASSSLYPKQTSSKFVALTFGSCSLTGILTNLSFISITYYLHNRSYHYYEYFLLLLSIDIFILQYYIDLVFSLLHRNLLNVHQILVHQHKQT